ALLYFWRSDRCIAMLWSALFIASVVSLLLLYRHSVYHYHPAMTLLILMSAVGWARIAEWKSWMRWAVPVIVLMFFTFQTFRGNTSQHVLADIFSGHIHSLAECYN